MQLNNISIQRLLSHTKHCVMPNHALTPLPTQLKPRRRRIRRTAFQTRRKQRPKQEVEEEEEDILKALPCDTLIALRTLRQDWPHEATIKLPRTPPILLTTQLDALLVDRGNTQSELATLVQREIREIRIPSGGTCYVLDEDYYQAEDEFKNLLAEVRSFWVLRTVVEDAVGEDGATKLVRQGYLTMRNEDSFFFAVPSMGTFLRQRENGKKEILAILRRERYKEMSAEALEARTLANSFFTSRWHVRDVVGGGQAEGISTTEGVLIRLIR